MKTAGKTCNRTVELVDIYPTLADLTGLIPPENLEGYSLVPLLADPATSWDHPAYTQVQRGTVPGHSVRTGLWRYTEWDFGKAGAELYNEETDPQELNNLASDLRYADVVKQMKNLLKKIHPVPVEGGKAAPDAKIRYCD